MKYKAVIADVDGTIMAPSEFPSLKPSEKLIEMVRKVTKKGVAFSIASGRSLSWVEEIIKGLNLKTPIILDNGARIYDCRKGQYIWESLLSKETAEKVLSVLKKDKTLRVYIADDDERLSGEAKITKWKISKILVLGVTPAKADKLYKELKMIPDIHATKSVSGTGEKSQSVHVTNFNATKQVAIGKLLEIMNWKKEEIIGIGDSYNDFPLLMACGLKVAMENAVPEIKEIADYIAPSYDEEGVVDVLERFILKKSQKSKVKSQNYNSKFKINKLHSLLGEDKNQTLVVVDQQGNKMGIATREVCHKGDGKTHLAFMAFVVDKEKKIILTKRSKKKSLWGGFWDASVVSHVLSNETPEIAAKRRGKEELGVEIDFQDLGAFYYFAKYGESCENEYCHVLIGSTHQEVVSNPIEIDRVKLAKFEELVKLVEKNPKLFTPWLKLALEKFALSEYEY